MCPTTIFRRLADLNLSHQNRTSPDWYIKPFPYLRNKTAQKSNISIDKIRHTWYNVIATQSNNQDPTGKLYYGIGSFLFFSYPFGSEIVWQQWRRNVLLYGSRRCVRFFGSFFCFPAGCIYYSTLFWRNLSICVWPHNRHKSNSFRRHRFFINLFSSYWQNPRIVL